MSGSADALPERVYRLLAIDDNADSAALLARIARKCGYEAEALSSQDQLPARLKSGPIDVLTLDLCMPDEDGIRVLSVLQQHEFKGAVVIVSGQESWLRKSAGRLAEGRGLRVAGDFAKPIDLGTMTRLLDELKRGCTASAA